MFEITLKGNFIYIRFFIDEMYEPDIMNEKKNKQKLYRDYCILKNIRDLFSELSTMFGIPDIEKIEEDEEVIENIEKRNSYQQLADVVQRLRDEKMKYMQIEETNIKNRRKKQIKYNA